MHRHYVSQDLERETEGQRRLYWGERQSDKLQANAGDAEEVQLLLQEEEAEDPSASGIARHLNKVEKNGIFEFTLPQGIRSDATCSDVSLSYTQNVACICIFATFLE